MVCLRISKTLLLSYVKVTLSRSTVLGK